VLAFLLVLLLPVRGNGEDVVAHVDVDIILAHARHRRLDDEFVVLLAHVDRKLGEARLGIPACRGAEPHKVAHGIQHAFHLTERIITPVRYQTGHVYVLLITSTRLIRVYDTTVRNRSAPALQRLTICLPLARWRPTTAGSQIEAGASASRHGGAAAPQAGDPPSPEAAARRGWRAG